MADEVSTESSRRAAWVTAGVGAAVTALGITTGVVLDTDVGIVIGLATGIGAPMITIRRLWSQVGAPKWWRKLLKGRTCDSKEQTGILAGYGALARHEEVRAPRWEQ